MSHSTVVEVFEKLKNSREVSNNSTIVLITGDSSELRNQLFEQMSRAVVEDNDLKTIVFDKLGGTANEPNHYETYYDEQNPNSLIYSYSDKPNTYALRTVADVFVSRVFDESNIDFFVNAFWSGFNVVVQTNYVKPILTQDDLNSVLPFNKSRYSNVSHSVVVLHATTVDGFLDVSVTSF